MTVSDAPHPKASLPAPYARPPPTNSPAAVTTEPTADGQDPSSKPVRVYADGIFDMFHFGHARALEQAKKSFPNTYLLVGCCNDADTNKYKGKTVMTEEERYESLRHCKWVDEVVRDAPWVITEEFLEQHNIDYVAHDDLPYADTSGQTDDVYGFVKKLGKFKATQRTSGISTSDLILRILKDYNEYVLRNLKRGYTRKQLGISIVKEQRLRASQNIKKVADRIQKRIAKPVRILPKSVEVKLADVIRRNGEELAENVEIVVEKVVRGEYGKQMAKHMDKYLTGFVRCFERSYSQIETIIRKSVNWSDNPQPRRRLS